MAGSGWLGFSVTLVSIEEDISELCESTVFSEEIVELEIELVSDSVKVAVDRVIC